MKLPLSWLERYVDPKLSPEKLEECLTMSGTKVEFIEKKNGDSILQIEVTTNRPDCLNILGLAREISALTGKKLNAPKISPEKKKTTSAKLPVVEIRDKKGCPKYTARLIRNVTIRQAPADVQKLLELVGTRPINNAVDATNFVLFEMGQPLHAFDYDKIKGGKIVVRRAEKGEIFLGIDGLRYTLDEKTLVIADAERAVAIAGVIGGKDTEVTADTKNILLESAYFDPVLVRRAARHYKISTESSYRFEREVDIENVNRAAARAKDLILEWGGGEEDGGLIDKDLSRPVKPRSIRLRLERLEKILGCKIPQKKILSILKDLGFDAKAAGKEIVQVKTLNARRDVNAEPDLAEEILRIEGFEKIPYTLPPTHYASNFVRDAKAEGTQQLKKYLCDLGFNEIVTYSLLSERSLRDAGFGDFKRAQKLRNPLSAEQEWLRPTLLPGMLTSVLFNVYRKAGSIKFFEIGNRYVDGREETVLALCLHGEFENNWLRRSAASFFDLKGIVENILEHLKIRDLEWREEKGDLTLVVDGKSTGTAELLGPSRLKNWDIPGELFFAEIVLDDLLKRSSTQTAAKVRSIPKFPSVRRDVAFILEESIPVTELVASMKNSAMPYLKEVRLFDEFKGKGVPSGKRSLAFSLSYQKDSGTFTDEEINSLQSRVGDALKERFHVEFR